MTYRPVGPINYTGLGGNGAFTKLPGAMPAITIDILGIPEMVARLTALTNDVTSGRTVEGALRAAALPIQNEWKRMAPFKTGTYRRSIHTEVNNQAQALIGTDITNPPYPEYLEYGTSKMAPHPSMRPAFDLKKEEAVEAFAAAMKSALRKYGAF